MKVLLTIVLLVSGVRSSIDQRAHGSNGDRIQCILYFSAYSCTACRVAFAGYIDRYNKGKLVTFSIALGFQRVREYRVFLSAQRNPALYIHADADFLAKHADLREGDIIVMRNAREVTRINMFTERWREALESVLSAPSVK
jgi:hypothetical protein